MMYLGDKAVGINNDNRDLKLISTVTITESLENDTTGNATEVYNNYIKTVVSNISAPNIIIVIADNNSANSYAIQKMIFTPSDTTGSIVLRKTGSTYSTRNIGNSTSAWCSAGTILNIYLLKGGDT